MSQGPPRPWFLSNALVVTQASCVDSGASCVLVLYNVCRLVRCYQLQSRVEGPHKKPKRWQARKGSEIAMSELSSGPVLESSQQLASRQNFEKNTTERGAGRSDSEICVAPKKVAEQNRSCEVDLCHPRLTCVASLKENVDIDLCNDVLEQFNSEERDEEAAGAEDRHQAQPVSTIYDWQRQTCSQPCLVQSNLSISFSRNW